MIKNYLKTALRTLRRNKLFSLINILGLSVGTCAALRRRYLTAAPGKTVSKPDSSCIKNRTIRQLIVTQNIK